jgi:hypothetical protein
VNIFVLHRDPVRAARQHCDRHVVKMTLETAQILSTVLWQRDRTSAQRLQRRGLLYRPTHAGHPCTLWAAKSLGNFRWLCRLGIALAEEYTHRYGKLHKSAAVIEAAMAWAESASHSRKAAHRHTDGVVLPRSVSGAHPHDGWPCRRTPFAQALPEHYRGPDAVAAYRAYYLGDKAPICSWTRRRAPRWFRAAITSQREIA